MVVELYVGQMESQYVAWCPLFPGVIAFASSPDKAVDRARIGCRAVLIIKRRACPSLPHPDLLDWTTRVGVPPPSLGAAYNQALVGVFGPLN